MRSLLAECNPERVLTCTSSSSIKGAALRKDASERILSLSRQFTKSNSRKNLSWENLPMFSSNKGIWKIENFRSKLKSELKIHNMLQQHTSNGR
jgi:fumarylacetoacetate (FAA) hydrolase family protein